MKYQPGLLDNFISPTTGQLASEANLPAIPEGYIWIGDRDGNAFPSLLLKDLLLDFQNLRANLDEAAFILQAPMEFLGSAQALNQLEDGVLKHHEGVISIAIPGEDFLPVSLSQGKLWRGDVNNKPAEVQYIDLSNMANLSQGRLWLGDGSGRPAETTTITIDNLPDLGLSILGQGKIWRGTQNGRPIESNDLSSLENSVTFTQFVTIPSIQGDILVINGEILILQGQVTGLLAFQIFAQGELIALASRMNSFHLEDFIISGTPDSTGAFHTQRGPTCLLTNIPAGGDVSMDSFRIKNLKQSPEETHDAISAQFLWDLMHDEVGVIWL